MRPHRLAATLVAAALGLTAAAGATARSTASTERTAQPSTLDLLLRSARLWEARGRPQLAQAALEKILRVQPGHAEALRRLGLILLGSERPEQAEVPLRTLQKLYPDAADSHELAEAYRIVVRDRKRFAMIRLLARAGRHDESIAELRRLFPQGAPRGELGIEYYRLLALAPASRNEARLGLERLSRDAPDDRRYQNALAALLLERPETRRQGWQLLARMGQRGNLGQDRQETWRQSLLAAPKLAAALPDIEQYLAVVPDDRTVRQRQQELLALQRQAALAARDPGLLATLAAEQAMAQADYEAAERELASARQLRPDDRALDGQLGLLRLKQGRHEEALALFEARQKQDPDKRQKWTRLAATARFWGRLQAARRLLAEGQFAAAEEQIRAALRLPAADPDGLLLLAEVQRRQGQHAAAEKTLRDRLAGEPEHDASLRSLIGLLLAEGRLADSAELLARRPPDAAAPAWDALAGDYWAQFGDREIAAQRRGPALAAYERSLALQPDQPWLALTLARLYAGLQMPELGREVLQKIGDNATSDDPAYARALFAAEQDETADALALLATIPVARRTPAMARLHVRLAVRHAIAEGRRQLGATELPQRWQGVAQLRQAEEIAWTAGEAREELLLSVLDAWRSAGLTGQALRLSEALLAAAAAPEKLLPRHLDLLLDAGREADFRQRLASEEAQLETTPEGRAILQRVDEEQRLASADALIAAGDGAAAAALLQPLLVVRPDSPRLRRTLAEALIAGHQTAAAFSLYTKIIAAQPDDLASRVDLARLLRRSGRNTEARQALDAALAQSPAGDHEHRLDIADEYRRLDDSATAAVIAGEILAADPASAEAHLLLGRIAENAARYEVAARHYRQAIALEQPADEATSGGLELQLSAALTTGQGTAPGAFNQRAVFTAAGDAGAPHQITNAAPSEITTPHDSAAPGFGADRSDEEEMPRMPPLRLAGELQRAVVAPTESAASPTRPPPSSAQRALAGLDERLNHALAGGFFQLDKPGDAGSSRLASRELLSELRWPLDYERQLFLRADQIDVDDGRHRYRGVMPGIGLNTERWRIDLGSTPLSFPVHYAVGGVRYNDRLGPYDWSLDLAQRPLDASLLAYSGLQDERSGEARGGVRARGLTGRIGASRGPVDGSLSVSWQQLLGAGVDANQRLRLRAAASHEWRIGEHQRLELGLVGNVWHYTRDLAEYPGRDASGAATNPGQGGYYSPQRYVSLVAPLSWRWWTEPYRVIASLSPSVSRANGEQGTGYAASLGVERDLGADWLFGLRLAIDRSESYTPNTGLLYFRHAFGRPTARVQERSAEQPQPLRRYADF